MKPKKTWHTTLALCGVLVLYLAAALLFYTNSLRKSIAQEVDLTLSEITAQSAMGARQQVNGKLELLEEAANSLSKAYAAEDLWNGVPALEQLAEKYGFKRLGVALPDGQALGTDTVRMNLSQREYFTQSMGGEPAVSNQLTDYAGGGAINVYSVPIFYGDEVKGVLFATYSAASFQKDLGLTFMNGAGYFYLVDKNGEAVMSSGHEGSFMPFDNIYESISELKGNTGEEAEQLRTLIESGAAGSVVISNNGVQEYLYCRPVGFSDWYMLAVAPVNIVNVNMNMMLVRTGVVGFVAISALLILMVYLSRMEKEQSQKLARLVYVDELTGGRSYAKFQEEAQKRLSENGAHYVLASLDISDFTLYNQLFGYEEGNRLLRVFYTLLFDKCESGREICCRRSADLFVALWQKSEPEALMARIEEFSRAAQRSNEESHQRFPLKISAGFYEIKEPNEEFSSMMDCADIARKTAKQKHNEICTFYDKDLQEQHLREKLMEGRMKTALLESEFEVYFQPQFSLKDTQIQGAEALVRWNFEKKEILSPGQFVPLFEENGFVAQLDTHVFEQVCRFQRQQLDAGAKMVPIAVNVSRAQFYEDGFVKTYCALLEKYDVAPRFIQLEITERHLLENQDFVCGVLLELHRYGFLISMDDFGTGYSSLSMLANVPLDVMKLDKSFIDRIGDFKGERVIASMIDLAHTLHLRVVAEGVETGTQWSFLRSLGCDEVQGYFLARPMKRIVFEECLKENKAQNPLAADAVLQGEEEAFK